MKLTRILFLAFVTFVAAQQPGNDARPFQFQSFGANQQPSPPQSFQRINFFGPLQQQQQQQEFRNPFFIPPSGPQGPQGPQDPRAGQRNAEFGSSSISASIQQTPANTGIFRQDSSPKPLFQFTFGTQTEQSRQPNQQRPFRPSLSADNPDSPVRPVSQLASLPVPLALRPRTPRPEPQRTEAPPQRVRTQQQQPEPAAPIRPPPVQLSDSQESSAERREPFQRVRPKDENKSIEPAKQSLSDQPSRDDRQLRNRLRRPEGSNSAEVQATRRVPPTRVPNASAESSSEIVQIPSTPSPGRGRARVTLSSAEVETLTTARPRGTFFRSRTTIQPASTSSEIESSTEEATTTRRPLLVARRKPQTNSAETEKPRVFNNNASILRLRNNGNLRLRGKDSSEQPATTSSERSVEESSTTPSVSVNAVDGPSSGRPEEETIAGDEEEDELNGEEEDDDEYEDDESTPEVETSTASTTTTTSTTSTTTTTTSTTTASTTISTTEAPETTTTLLTTTPSTTTTTESPKAADETEPQPTQKAAETTTTTSTSAKPQEEAESAQPEAGEDADQRRPAKLEILGQSNATSANLDNVVFVPNLQGLQVQQRTTTSTTTTLSPTVETSRSVVTLEQSSDSQSERQSKAIDNSKSDNRLPAKQIIKDEQDAPSVEEKATTSESSIDELDRLQSGLFNKHLTNLTNNLNTDSEKSAKTSTEAPIVTSRAPFRPSFERPRHPFDILNAPRSTTTTSTESTGATESTSESTTSTVETSTLSLFERLLASKSMIKDDMSALLPPGFANSSPEASSTEATTTTTTEAAKSVKPFDKLFGGLSVKFDDVSSLLPPGFKLPDSEPVTESSTTTTTKSSIGNLFETVVLDDLSGLLPPGFKNQLFTPSSSTESTNLNEETTTTRKTGLVFPTRASPARNVTTEKPRSKPTFAPIEIKSGWPVRATTEFTGWPSPPTPAPTAPVTSSTTPKTTTTRTTTTTTTTTTTPRVTTPGVCGELCRLAGTVRLVNGVDWVPELRDHNTREWYQLADAVKNELDDAYQNGPLAPWYTGIEVEAFSRGSVLVDYYLTLNGTADLDTGEIRNYFHLSLEKEGDELKLGNYTVDPKSTDFIVVPQSTLLGERERVATGVVSEWVIAVIVVGLASLIFVIAFGATMMIRRRRQHKRKSVPLTEEMLNELNKNHMTGADNSSGDSFYDVGDAWDHRTAFPTKPIKPLPRPASVNAIRSHGTAGFANYHSYNNFGNQFGARAQLHDLWKSEWDSPAHHYYDHSNSGTAQRIKAVPRPATSYGRYPTYGRPRPDYDDDF